MAIRAGNARTAAIAAVVSVAPVVFVSTYWVFGTSNIRVFERISEEMGLLTVPLIICSIPAGVYAVLRARGVWRAVGLVGIAATASLTAWNIWFVTGS